jgi:hypothetical protein
MIAGGGRLHIGAIDIQFDLDVTQEIPNFASANSGRWLSL